MGLNAVEQLLPLALFQGVEAPVPARTGISEAKV